MANDHPDEHEEEERYDDLEAVADESRDDLGIEKITQDLISSINQTDALVDANELIAHADEITTSSGIDTGGEVFADDTDDEAFDSLVSRTQQLTNQLGDVGRGQARETFLAAQLGFVAGDHKGATADRVLALVSKFLETRNVKNLPADLDPTVAGVVSGLAASWTFTEETIFQRLAGQY